MSILSSLKSAFTGLGAAFSAPAKPATPNPIAAFTSSPLPYASPTVPKPVMPTIAPAPKQNFTPAPVPMSTVPKAMTPAPVRPAVPTIQSPSPVYAPTPAPVAAAPAYRMTSSGATINPATGSVVPPIQPVSSPTIPQTPRTETVTEAPVASTPSYTSPEYEAAVKAYQESQNLSDEEIQNMKDQATLDESLRSTFTNIEGQAIPLEFVTGQKENVQQRATNLSQSLQAKAAILQAKRVAATNASKFALDETKDRIKTYNEQNKPITLSEGQIVIDPKTGKQIASGLGKTTAKDAAQDPKRVLSVTEAQTLGVPFGTTAEQAYGKGQSSGDPNSPSAPQNILSELTGLRDHAGKGFATGMSSAFNLIPGTPAASFVDKLNSVKALLTLPNLGLLKGAMSDKDISFIQSAGTSLATSNTESDFNDTLNKIITKYETAVQKQQTMQEESAVKQMRSDGVPDNVIEQVLGKKLSFNQVGNTSVSIPESSRLAFANNNPGNLRYAGQVGATKGEGGFAKFATPEAGAKALESQIKLDASRGLTLAAFVNKYAPPSENNTQQYISQIVAMLGVKPETKVKDIDIKAITSAIARKESGSKIA